MKNFPSSLLRQKNTKNGLGSNLKETLKNTASQVLTNMFGATSSKNSLFGIESNFNEGYERGDIETKLNDLNILSHNNISKMRVEEDTKFVSLYDNVTNNGEKNLKKKFEDPFVFTNEIFSAINNYSYVFSYSVPYVFEKAGIRSFEEAKKKDTNNIYTSIIENIVVPSMFNPYASISVTGVTEGIPLTDTEPINTNERQIDLGNTFDENSEKYKGDKNNKDIPVGTLIPGDKDPTGQLKLNSGYYEREDTSDCSIRKLVELSGAKRNGPTEKNTDKGLGLATYRYIDFMYCKDLGKIPNNRLITLRKFPGPIGDNIFREAHWKNRNNGGILNTSAPDIGRLITWFDNEDNKLEDICRYNYKATWKPFRAEIQQMPSQQQDTGFVNQLANFLSPSNNLLVGSGFSGNNSLIFGAAKFLHIPLIGGSRAQGPYYDSHLMSNYDQHRIYEPKDRIWDTHKYEGRLEFNQEISLTFRYVLRSYANINPKTAMLDLLGNIQAVTYRRGSFWGGEQKVYGPHGNSSVYKKANAFIDNTFEKLGGIWHAIANGDIDLSTIAGFLSSAMEMAEGYFQKALETAKQAVDGGIDMTKQMFIDKAKDVGEKVKGGMNKLEEWNKKYHWTDALKGMIKNQLGRPPMYAFNSLLSGEPVGPWHLTIGNPRNPIMVMGNLILEQSEITHSGPLGLDDFPSELIVKVTLKHAIPRDSVGIQRMYTKGKSAIHLPLNMIKSKNYWANKLAFPDLEEVHEGVLKQSLAAI